MGILTRIDKLCRYQTQKQKLISFVMVYVVVELWRLRRFRRLHQRLQARSYIHKGKSSFLSTVLKMMESVQAPLTIDRSYFAEYIKESSLSVGYGGGFLNWQRMYSWWAWGCGRPFDSPYDPQLHADLLRAADLSCKAIGIDGPPPKAAVPAAAPSPFGFGVCEIRATFKPLPVRLLLRGLRMLTRCVLRALGFRMVVEPMPSGNLVCWTDVQPRESGKPSSGRPPVVFLHGLGLGIFTYLPLFLGEGARDWRAGGCIIVEMLSMTSSSEELEGRPEVMHSADALGRLLRTQLGYGDFEYDVVCHSLSAYLVAALCNEGSPCRPRRSVLIDPVCFIDGAEVCGRFPFRTPEECWKFVKNTVLFPKFLPLIVRRLLGHMFRQMVCKDIFTQYSVLRWNGTDATSILWHAHSAEALVCLSDDDNFLPAERVARHCSAHFPQIELYRMPRKDHGSFVIEGDVRSSLLRCIANYLDKEDQYKEVLADDIVNVVDAAAQGA